MGNLLEAIEHSTTDEIEAGGMLYRVKKISSADLAKVGHAALALGQMLNEPTPAKKRKAKKEREAMDDPAQLFAKQPVDTLETMAKLKDAVVAAGVVAVGNPTTQQWEPVELVIDKSRSDARQGRLWVGALPNEVADQVFQAVMDVSTDGGRSLERLREFRGEPANPTVGGPSGQTIRQTAK